MEIDFVDRGLQRRIGRRARRNSMELGWMACFRRLSRDYERLTSALAGVLFVCLMLPTAIKALAASGQAEGSALSNP